MESNKTKQVLSQEEIQKYVILTRLFFCKMIESIYYNRCPKELSDFTEDKEHWFSLDIPQSQSLRKLIGGETPYGWFKLDVVLSDSNCVIERWIISNKDYKPTDSRTILVGDCKNIKSYIYKRFSKMMRSVYSTMNMMPAKILELQISNLVSTGIRLKAFCSHFMELPVVLEPISNNDDIMEVDFGNVTTPIGICSVKCYSIKAPSKFVPSFIKTELPPINPIFQFQNFTYPSDYSSSLETSNLIFDDSFCQASCSTQKSSENSDSMNKTDFLSYLSSLKINFEPKISLEKLKTRLGELQKEAEVLKEDWNSSSFL